MLLFRQAHKIAQANFRRQAARSTLYYYCSQLSSSSSSAAAVSLSAAITNNTSHLHHPSSNRKQSFFSTMMTSSSSSASVHGIFHKGTSTMTYIVSCPSTKSTLIIDSVLDYDSSSGRTSNTHNEATVQYCTDNNLNVQYILESHVHADHLTGAQYLKEKFPSAKTGIGANVTKVQETFSKIFNYTETELKTDGSQFDVLFKDGDKFNLGELEVKVLNTPGHTPACVCYVVGEDCVFTGDTIFMPDFGTARCDFPGGSSSSLYTSIKRLYDELPDNTRVYVGHDYQPGGRDLLFQTTIGEEKSTNKQLKGDTSMEDFATWRSERDGQLGMPKLLLPSIQVNLRNGEFPKEESNGVSYLKIPINFVGK